MQQDNRAERDEAVEPRHTAVVPSLQDMELDDMAMVCGSWNRVKDKAARSHHEPTSI